MIDLTSGQYPFLLTRACPNPDIATAFNEWQRSKHLPDLMAGTSRMRCTYALPVGDPLPAVYRGTSGCLAYYVGPSVSDLLDWSNGPTVASAVADGSRWFGSFSMLDSYQYTGNVYCVLSTSGGQSNFDEARSTWLVERFEVEPGRLAAFDSWATTHHVPRLSEVYGVQRSRLVAAVRDGVDLDYYLSVGNRAVITELEPASDVSVLMSQGALTAMQDSQQWDRSCTYAMREVYRHFSDAGSDDTVSFPGVWADRG